MLESIKKMLNNFEKYDIQYCHWKSNEHIDEALEGDTDLDILFSSNQRILLEKVLAESGLKRFRATPLMQYNSIEDYIGLDYKTGKIWHLHLHYRLSLGEKHLKGYTFPWDKDILERKELYDNKIYCSNPSDEFLLLLIRISLKLRWRDFNRKICSDDICEIKWLREKTSNKDVINKSKLYLDEKTVREIKKILVTDIKRYRQFFKLQKSLRKNLKNFTGYTRKSSYFTRSKREIFWFYGGVQRRLGLNSVTPTRRISPKGGVVVVLLGCDGAGKSTTLKNIKKEFSKKIDVYCEYLGSGDGRSMLIRKPMKLIAKKIGGKGVGTSIDDQTNGKRKKILKRNLYHLSRIIWAITLAYEKKKKYRKINKARNNGMLVLVDRYPQTEFSNFSDGPLLSRYLKKEGIMKKIALWELTIYQEFYKNPPELLVKLVVPVELAIQRKPEMTRKEIENKTNAIKQMNFNTNEIIIDTSKEMLETKKEVMSCIWDYI